MDVRDERTWASDVAHPRDLVTEVQRKDRDEGPSWAVPRRGLAVQAWQLFVDAYTTEVVTAFAERGLRSILLKGPAIVSWLYADDQHLRPYCDADLLVAPSDHSSAVEILLAAGMRPSPHPRLPEDGRHALSFSRPSDGATVDLHHSLHGMTSLPSSVVWEAAARDAQLLQVNGIDVHVLGSTMRLLHVALHPRAIDGPESKPWRDLTRALELSSIQEWDAAIAVARRLGITHEVSARLKARPDCGWLLERLGDQPVARYFHLVGAVDSGRAPTAVLSIEQLVRTPSLRGKLCYARAKLIVPSTELSPTARNVLATTRSLVLARMTHALTLAARMPSAMDSWRRERRGRDHLAAVAVPGSRR